MNVPAPDVVNVGVDIDGNGDVDRDEARFTVSPPLPCASAIHRSELQGRPWSHTLPNCALSPSRIYAHLQAIGRDHCMPFTIRL